MNTIKVPNRATRGENSYPKWQWQPRQAAWQRNLRTAAAIGLAISGGAISTACLAGTAAGTCLALSAWHYRQTRKHQCH